MYIHGTFSTIKLNYGLMSGFTNQEHWNSKYIVEAVECMVFRIPMLLVCAKAAK